MKSNSNSALLSTIKKFLWCALALSPLFTHAVSHAAERKQTMGSVQIQGVGKLNLIGSIPEGAGAESVSKLQINFGKLPLIAFPTQDLEHCREGSPAVLNPRGEPLADLMDHPKVNGILAAFPEARNNVHIHLSCGAKDDHGLPTLHLSMEQEGETFELGQARINPSKDEWEFVDVDGNVFSSSRQVVVDPKAGEVSANGSSTENDSTQGKNSIDETPLVFPSIPNDSESGANQAN